MKINDDEDNDNNDVRVINEASVSGNSFVLHEGEKKKKKRKEKERKQKEWKEIERKKKKRKREQGLHKDYCMKLFQRQKV